MCRHHPPLGRRRRPNRHAHSPSPPFFALQARKLESELDIKVAAYGKLCSSYEYGYSKGESGLATDQVRQAGRCWVLPGWKGAAVPVASCSRLKLHDKLPGVSAVQAG